MNKHNLSLSLMIVASLGCSTFQGSPSTLSNGQSDPRSSGALINVGGRQLFLNGINIAWNYFGRDFGNFAPDSQGGLDSSYFDSTFTTLSQAGANTIRWWVHTSGEFNPRHDADGYYSCNDPLFLRELAAGMDLAATHNLHVVLTLWSFDMLDKNKNPNVFGDKIVDRNVKLLTNPDYFNAYLNNCYIPLITAIKDKPALLAIDVFNEPEAMTEVKNWDAVTTKVPMKSIQSFVNIIAGTTHRLAPSVQVTVGAVGVDYLSYYTDQQLISAGNDVNGTLDFYQAHYYGSGTNPFTTNAKKIASDKPLMLGELAANNHSLTDIYQILYQRGYAGVLSWKFKATPGDPHGTWDDGFAGPALSCLAAGQPQTVIGNDHPASVSQLVAQYLAQCPLGEANSYPLCLNPASADANNDGWGFENNSSCRVFDVTAATSGAGGAY